MSGDPVKLTHKIKHHSEHEEILKEFQGEYSPPDCSVFGGHLVGAFIYLIEVTVKWGDF